MDYFKKAIDAMDWSSIPIFGSMVNSPKMQSVLDYYSTKNRYAEKNRHTWEIAMEQLRIEESLAKRRNDERRD
jgi:hypothetical protein